jgi:FtsP/CotA-like multicopper oxidase with cupredoxin domain
MSSGGSPYVVPLPVDTNPGDPTVLETEIVAARTTGVDIGLPAGLLANIETFNGAIPGPTLKLNVNDTVIVRLINLLDHPTGIHWHGIELANSADGTEVTQEPVLPAFTTPPPSPAPAGGSYLYKFKVPRPGLYWYHPHHHVSINRVFRGLYGMIVVADPNEAALIAAGVIPGAANTRQIVLSDITVCKAANDAATYVNPTTVMPATDAAEWISGNTAQPGPAPRALCEMAPTGSATKDDHDGTAAVASWPVSAVPSIVRPPGPGGGRTNEGQTVLTNGVNVGARAGVPLASGPLGPGALAPGAHLLDVQAGQGLRLQIANCCTTRYCRLILTTNLGVQVPLWRIGGEGGLLDSAIQEGGSIPDPVGGLGPFDTKYLPGEILLPPASRVDVVAAIPAGATGVLTMWTRDFQRTGGGFADMPTVPVMHLNVVGAAPVAYAIDATTLLRASIPGAAVPALGSPNATLLTPAGGFVAPKFGMADQDIALGTVMPLLGVNGVVGTFEPFVPYSSAPHIGSSRYAETGRILELTVTNGSGAHHPFHLHGFSFQPIRLTQPGSPTFTWPYREFRDNIDLPSNYTLTFRVRLEDRTLLDGVTLGGALGRWLFHCHIFFHHHRGMISELVVTDASGREKPNVDVGGSWAYAPSMGTAKRSGTFFSLDSTVVSLTATDAAGTPVGSFTTFVPGASGTWAWEYVSPGGDDSVRYVYITGTDALGRKDQAVFRLKIGAPDDGADNGDPHISTVDGHYYDFQSAGEFTLLRDTEGLEIQVRQTPVPTATPITDDNSGLTTCVSVNTAVAARIGASRIAYQPMKAGDGRLQFFLDGKPADLTERGIDLEAGRVSAYQVGATTALRVDYANHTVLTVTPWFWTSNNVWLLNVSVSHTDADQGLMGRIPPQTWLPKLPNGATVGPRPAGLHERYIALYKTFADAWRVTDQTSLFVYAPGTSTQTFTDLDWPTEKPPCKQVKPEFQIPGANPPLVGIKPDVAERLCKPVTEKDLHLGCVFDVATTGDKTLVENYLLAQELRRNGTAVQIVSDKPRTRPGESVVFTATVTALTKGRPIPGGTISFLVDDVPAEKPVDLDKRGRATLKTASLSIGVHRVRAVYAAGGDTDFYLNSSSPGLRHPVEKRAPANRSQAPYRIRGLFYEACDCFTVCPCWMGNNPDGGECTGVFAWEIEQGSIDGVDVTGLKAVSVSHHVGDRDEAKQRVVIFVDDRATRQQADALAAAFSGRLGGPLQELADILGQLAGVERAPIELRRDGRVTTLIVDHRIRIEGAANEGPSGRPMALNDGRLSQVLGSPAEVGESGRFRIGLKDHGMEMDVRGRSTMSGRFSYVHTPKPGAPETSETPGAHRG